jgi:hypothetical protein
MLEMDHFLFWICISGCSVALSYLFKRLSLCCVLDAKFVTIWYSRKSWWSWWSFTEMTRAAVCLHSPLSQTAGRFEKFLLETIFNVSFKALDLVSVGQIMFRVRKCWRRELLLQTLRRARECDKQHQYCVETSEGLTICHLICRPTRRLEGIIELTVILGRYVLLRSLSQPDHLKRVCRESTSFPSSGEVELTYLWRPPSTLLWRQLRPRF